MTLSAKESDAIFKISFTAIQKFTPFEFMTKENPTLFLFFRDGECWHFLDKGNYIFISVKYFQIKYLKIRSSNVETFFSVVIYRCNS